MKHISEANRRQRLGSRHLLMPSARVGSLAAVADRLVALHSSDPASVFLAACARMSEPSIAAVEAELYDDPSVVRFHAMRRTIWVMTPPVAQDANAGFTRKIARAEHQRSATLFGRDEAWFAEAVDRVTAVVERAGGPIGTREIGRAVTDLAQPVVVSAGKKYEAKIAAHSRALLQAAFEGRIIRVRPAGTWIGSQYAWVANDAVLGIDWYEPTELVGATEIVRRWLERFGPGTLDDIVWWTGSTKTLIRQVLAACDAAEVELDNGDTGFVLPDDLDNTAPEPDMGPWVALLPGLDPSAMGWKQRGWYLDADIAGRVTDRNGNIGPTIWAGGRIVGGWVQRPDGSIAHDADRLSRDHRTLLDIEIDRLQSIVGDTRFTVRFPSPNQKTLST